MKRIQQLVGALVAVLAWLSLASPVRAADEVRLIYATIPVEPTERRASDSKRTLHERRRFTRSTRRELCLRVHVTDDDVIPFGTGSSRAAAIRRSGSRLNTTATVSRGPERCQRNAGQCANPKAHWRCVER